MIALPAEDLDDRRKRRIAFVVITLVFVISVAALIYWAVNVAAARISSKLTVNFHALNPIKHGANYEANQPLSIIFQSERKVTA